MLLRITLHQDQNLQKQNKDIHSHPNPSNIRHSTTVGQHPLYILQKIWTTTILMYRQKNISELRN